MTGRSSPPRWAAHWLMLCLMLWLCTELGTSAKEGPRAGTGCTHTVCCARTQQASDQDAPCCEDPASGGKCGAGKCCANTKCTECRTLPKCGEGEELHCLGTIDFRFLCKACPPGTYSDTKNGCCIPWADCAKIGLKAIRPGNRTHNVQCGTVILQPDSPITTVLAIVTATGMFVLILITFFLIVCMWTQKKANFHVIEDPESASDPKLPEPQEVHEDSYSCQFPEEEHGDKMAEEKTSLKASGH